LTHEDLAGSVLELLADSLENRRQRESNSLAKARHGRELIQSLYEQSALEGTRRFFCCLVRGPLEYEYDPAGPPDVAGSGFHSAQLGRLTIQARTAKPVHVEDRGQYWQRLGAPHAGAWEELSFLQLAKAVDAAQRKVITPWWRIKGSPEAPWKEKPAWYSVSEIHDTDSPGWRSKDHEPLSRFVIMLPAELVSADVLQRLAVEEWSGDNESDILAGLPRLSDLLAAAGRPLLKTSVQDGKPLLADEDWRKTALEQYQRREPVDDPPGLDEFRPLWPSDENSPSRDHLPIAEPAAESDTNEPEAPAEEAPAPKRRRGRPKGAKDSKPRRRKPAVE